MNNLKNIVDMTVEPGIPSPLKRSTWNAYFGGQLTFGPNATQRLAAVIQKRSAKRIFLITDSVLEEAGLVRQVRKAIDQTSAELQVCTDGEVEPTTTTVDEVAAKARSFQPDLVVALGGGSNMDLAKACCALLTNETQSESLMSFDQVANPMHPLVCLPTTAGTGSEISHAAVLTNVGKNRKEAILSNHIRPHAAIVDPYMTISCPPKVTAESGMDALTHAIEALVASNFFQFDELPNGYLPFEGNNPFGDVFAEQAIGLIGLHLKTAVDEPENLTARTGMSLAATFAGFAFSNCGVAMCHALEYPIGGTAKECSHGAGNGIVLPAMMRFVRNNRPGKLARIGRLLDPTKATHSTPDDEAADIAIETVEQIRAAIGLPERLRDVGIVEEQLPGMAQYAFAVQLLINLTPGSPTLDDTLSILKASW